MSRKSRYIRFSSRVNEFVRLPRPIAIAILRHWKSSRPTPGSTTSWWIFDGSEAATSSMSTPPSALAITTMRWESRSTNSER